MAAPTSYDRQYNFANYQALNPDEPLPGSQVDAELNAVKIATDSLAENLGLIQADDGGLQNGIIQSRHLASTITLDISPPEAWATATNYAETDSVFYEAKLYRCLEAHLSDVFATDLAAEKWELVADFVAAVNSATNISFTPAGAVAAVNVQAAIEEVATDAATALAALAAGDILVKTAFGAGSAERVVTDTDQVKWDWDTAGQAKVGVYKKVPSTYTANDSILSAQRGALLLVDTSAGAVTLTLPTLTAEHAGWWVDIIKVNAGTNPYFIAPPSGTLQSGDITGLAKTRRCIPGAPSRALWTGTAWIVERAVKGIAVGACIEYHCAALPVGYEWPNGQMLSSASTNYPDFYAKNGNSGVTLDRRGRVGAGKDDMGGSSANRLTNQSGGLDGDTLGAAGGAETHTLTTAQMPSHTHTQNAHTHTYTAPTGSVAAGDGGQIAVNTGTAGTATSSTTAVNQNTGGDGAHNNVQPTIVANYILVVE